MILHRGIERLGHWLRRSLDDPSLCWVTGLGPSLDICGDEKKLPPGLAIP